MTFFFLEKDLNVLNSEIKKLTEQIKEVAKEAAEGSEGGNEWHDNFSYEEGRRIQEMLSLRLKELTEIRQNARLIQPPKLKDRAIVGCVVTIKYLDTNEIQTFEIGGYIVFDNRNAISYNAPLARMLIGARVEEIREAVLGKTTKRIQIIAIS
ncbi:MAG: GreA/GreB family elongation factor [Candidatus Paceibacterota bacterium]|jgi:transcription elongation GreA/GreB family factor